MAANSDRHSGVGLSHGDGSSSGNGGGGLASFPSSSSCLRQHNVRVIGSGRHLLLLSHGFGTNQRVWDGVLACLDLENEYRVILWDLMGTFSTNPENFEFQRYSSLHAHADDLLEVLEELQAEDVTFVGHSMSGMLGLLASYECPHIFRQFILIGASCRYLNEARSGYVGGFEVNDLDQLFAAMQANYSQWVSGFAPQVTGESVESPSVREYSRTLFLIRPDIALSTLKMIFKSDFRHVLPQVPVPVHILQTAADTAVPTAVGEYMRDHVGSSTGVDVCYEVLPVEGHLPHLTSPEVVASAIARHAAVRDCKPRRTVLSSTS